ncbi:hypothetical protein J2X55_000670 [Microbacterium sp. 1154]|uniref:hypothetical protein n=1 Tax=Microbacterium sp. 1154 TaxID=2817733 RepID=UPI000E24D663|nr:hypothetical protein [Microbacterium sp. 1154]MDR6689771.1 hypothetical protein [Microbacterium sp. 1154]
MTPDVQIPGGVPSVTGVVPSAGGGGNGASGGLAITGLNIDVALLCIIAAILLGTGIAVAVRARRHRRPQRASRSLGRSSATAIALGFILMLGFAAPTPGAQAAVRSGCDAVQVTVVSIDPAPSAGGSIVLLPGAAPTVVTAKVTNTTNVPVSLFALSSTDPSAPLASQVAWTAQRGGVTVTSILTNTDAHALGTLAAGETADVTFTLSLPAGVGNEYQGQTASASLFVRVVESP